MITFLRKLFRRPRGLERLARSSHRDTFLQRLRQSDVLVFAALDGEGLDPSTMTEEQMLAEIERAVKDMNERQDGFRPFVYERDGRRRLPFFTSDSHAQTFAGEYSKERNRVYPFQWLGVNGLVLAQLLPACDLVVMNDRTSEEVVLTDTDLAAMRQWPGQAKAEVTCPGGDRADAG